MPHSSLPRPPTEAPPYSARSPARFSREEEKFAALAAPSARVLAKADPLEVPVGTDEPAVRLDGTFGEGCDLDAARIRASNLEAVGELAAGIAHEINTPMQYIGDNVHFLRRAMASLSNALAKLESVIESHPELAGPIVRIYREEKIPHLLEQIPKALTETIEGVDAVTRMVRALKEFSHPGTSAMAPQNINKAIETTIMVAKNEWKYVADLRTDLDPGLPLVLCNGGEINQVFLNLIVNAAHAIHDRVQHGDESRGIIRIATRRSGREVEIRVSDNGCGIPEAVRDRIFEPFFTTKEVGRGTGQGLRIVRSIVRDHHGGTVSFDTVEGRGSTFLVRLPLNESSYPETLETEE